MTGKIVEAIGHEPNPDAEIELLKVITSPFTKLVIQVRSSYHLWIRISMPTFITANVTTLVNSGNKKPIDGSVKLVRLIGCQCLYYFLAFWRITENDLLYP